MGGIWKTRSPNIKKAGRPISETYRHKKPLDYLTMVELKQLYEMHQAGCNTQTIALYMRITKEYTLECIEAAKWLYSGQLNLLKQRRLNIFIQPTKTPHKIIFKDDDRTVNKRPPAIYTNARPYDFDAI